MLSIGSSGLAKRHQAALRVFQRRAAGWAAPGSVLRSAQGARQSPDLPPRFSMRRTPSITIALSIALAMSYTVSRATETAVSASIFNARAPGERGGGARLDAI